MAHQVGHEAEDTLQDADEDRLGIGVVLGDGAPQVCHPLLEAIGGDEDPVDALQVILRQGPVAILGQEAVVVPLIQELDVDLWGTSPEGAAASGSSR